MKIRVVALVVLASALVGANDAVVARGPLEELVPARRPLEREYEAALASVPSAASLRELHALVGSLSHRTGTPGDAELVERLVAFHAMLGLEVERVPIAFHLIGPGSARVEIVSPEPRTLALAEPEAMGGLDSGWLAWSGRGEVEGEVVFAGFGRAEDFAALQDRRVRVEGAVAIVRRGDGDPGWIAREAERAGAAAVLVYPDPEDRGWGRGIPWPEGGWLDGGAVERGSARFDAAPGDPASPSRPAAAGEIVSPPEVPGLPRIPVQPIGWDAAAEILGRMRGPVVPREWQGGLPFAYRCAGGPELRVRVEVEPRAETVASASVLARIEGAVFPEELVVLGAPHDAFGDGALDPGSGQIVLLEVARAFAELARRGIRPERTLLFASWGASEVGQVGSTEWVEADPEGLRRRLVAYLDLTEAAGGPELRVTATPELVPFVEAVRGEVAPDAAAAVAGSPGERDDALAFAAHLGAPVITVRGTGADGAVRHTVRDTLGWYRAVVGESYEPALLATRLAATLAARLANADVVPLEPAAAAAEVLAALPELARQARDRGIPLDLVEIEREARAVGAIGRQVHAGIAQALDEGSLAAEGRIGLSWELRELVGVWTSEPGLPGRPWFRNRLHAPSRPPGLGPLLPGLRGAIAAGDGVLARSAVADLLRSLRLTRTRYETLGRLVLAPEALPASASAPAPPAAAGVSAGEDPRPEPPALPSPAEAPTLPDPQGSAMTPPPAPPTSPIEQEDLDDDR